MQLSEAFQLIWQNAQEPRDTQGILNHLNEIASSSYQAVLDGNYERAKIDLEDAFFCILLAYKRLGLNPEKTISRQTKQLEKKNQKVMLIKSNKVEIIVNGIPKGKWSIWDNEDVEDAKKIAKDFGIKVILENS